MKKLYLFIAAVFAMLCTVSVSAQKYSLETEATDGPEPGVTYAIMNAETSKFISCKYGTSGGLLEVMDDEDVLWQIEATGEKTEAGYDLWYLKSVGQNLYVQEVDLEGHPGLDGYDVYNYNGFNWELTDDKSKAAKIVIAKGTPGEDVEEGEVWRTNGPSSGFVISRQNLPIWISGDGIESPKMMKISYQGANVAWEPYNDGCVSWQFWTVKKLSAQEELEQLIDNYSKTEFVAGNDPGFYRASVVEAYNSSLESAMMLVLQAASEEEYEAAVKDLRAKREAVEGALIPLTEGYYFIISGFDDFLNNFGVEKAVYDNTSANLIAYKNLDETDVNFVWYIAPNTNSDAEENEFWVQNYATGNYVYHGTQWYSSSTPLTPDPSEPQNIRQYTSGKWYWGSRTYHNTSYTPYASSSPVASDSQGNLTSWGQWSGDSTKNTHFNLWYLRTVDDEKMADFADKKAQVDRTQQVNDLVTEAKDLYAKLFTYTPGEEDLITVAGGNGSIDAGTLESNVEGNQIAFYHFRGQGVATSDDYKFLIDGDDETYMQGSGYIDIDISQTPQRYVTFEYSTRCASMEKGNANQHKWGVQERPNFIQIYAAKDTVDGGDWAMVGSTSLGALKQSELTEPFDPVFYTLDLGDTYGFIRYEVISNANGGSYFTLSEFQVHPASVDETTSQYYTTEGMSEKADVLFATANAKMAIADQATEADIAELKAALAEVKELYADTAALAALAAECEVLGSTAIVGEEIGQVSNQDVADALAEAAATAKAMISPAITVDEVKAQMAALRTAKENFLNVLNTFEPNTFYYLQSPQLGQNLYASAPDRKTTLKVGTNDGKYDEYAAETMWMFAPAEGEGTYYVQNVATGFYLTEASTDGTEATLSYKPVVYEINYSGDGAYTFVPTNAMNKQGLAIGVDAVAGEVEAKAIFTEPNPAATSWVILPLSEDVEAISATITPGIGVLALPYNLSDEFVDLNEGLTLYGIKNMTQEEKEGELETTIDLYKKTEVAANEAVIYQYSGTEPIQLTIPLPSTLSSTKEASNGIVGMLYAQAVKAGVARSTGEAFEAVSGTPTIAAQTGVIDPATFKAEVADVETDMTLVITGLKPMKTATVGDVNGDGEVNTSDVVAVYNFIIDGTGVTKEAADVNGDGDVNSTDVVAIYNLIISGNISGESAGSKSFYPMADGDD
ncbi:MAG: dockerin type I repeat-containing protein, partial [Bacteroidaceae bacterium]|nr:dockerin type I repeat-containing protein [Bacteroidaceae bacterium]